MFALSKQATLAVAATNFIPAFAEAADVPNSELFQNSTIRMIMCTLVRPASASCTLNIVMHIWIPLLLCRMAFAANRNPRPLWTSSWPWSTQPGRPSLASGILSPCTMRVWSTRTGSWRLSTPCGTPQLQLFGTYAEFDSLLILWNSSH